MIDAMLEKYGLADVTSTGHRIPRKGAPVAGTNNMPYDVWADRDKSKRAKWHQDNGTSPWYASAEERARNQADYDARMSKPKGWRQKAADVAEGVADKAKRVGRMAKCVTGLGFVLDALDFWSLRDRAKENDRTILEQIDEDARQEFEEAPLPIPIFPFWDPNKNPSPTNRPPLA